MADDEATTTPQPKRPTPKASKTLPTNRISVTKQFDLLRAFGALYAAHARPVRQQEVADMVSLHYDTSRLANGFFLDTGLLQRTETGLIPNDDVQAYHRASQWNADGAEHKLQRTLRDTWFGKALLTKLSFAGALDETEALALLAEQAGASPEHRPNLQALLGFLETTGLIGREGNTLRAARLTESDSRDEPQRDDARQNPPPPSEQGTPQSKAMRKVTLPRCQGTLTLMGEPL